MTRNVVKPILTHPHPSPAAILAQVHYQDLPESLETARAIIAAKINQSVLFLTGYIRSRRRSFSDQAEFLIVNQTRSRSLLKNIAQIKDHGRLFQLEALAGRLHWRSISILCHQDNLWRRVHPQARDPLNILLNSGYVMLARHCLQAITQAGLLPEIAILHSANSKDPLVYDLMEIFRIIAVDSVIIPILARRSKKDLENGDHASNKILGCLAERYAEKFWYRNRCELLSRIIQFETVSLRRAIMAKAVWQPYSYRWGHRHSCQ